MQVGLGEWDNCRLASLSAQSGRRSESTGDSLWVAELNSQGVCPSWGGAVYSRRSWLTAIATRGRRA